MSEPTPHSTFLRGLAGRIGAAHAEQGATAVLVVGSSAEGIADEWSDLDLILFYDALPTKEALDATSAALGASRTVVLGGAVEAGIVLEQHDIEGIACQLVHQTVDVWRAQAATVLEGLEAESTTQKALQGLHAGLPLHGDDLIATLRAEAAYPEGLRAAMVRANLGVFPLWLLQGGLVSRDADLWQHAELVAALQHLVGALAGANSTWFSTFQLKKLGRLVAGFEHKPDRFVERVLQALRASSDEAASLLRDLVLDVVAILEVQVPEVDVRGLRGGAERPAFEPWQLPTS